MAYDSHRDITKLATETLTYDDASRHMATTLADGTSIVYKRDATDRIISVTQTPTGGAATVTNYAYAGGGDAAAVTLTRANHVQEQTISLPGGPPYLSKQPPRCGPTLEKGSDIHTSASPTAMVPVSTSWLG
ncbi:hypothetical protein GCM10027406_13850 [Leifsonia lichenia]